MLTLACGSLWAIPNIFFPSSATEKMRITTTTTKSNSNFFFGENLNEAYVHSLTSIMCAFWSDQLFFPFLPVHTLFCSKYFHLSQEIDECLQKHKVVQLHLLCCQVLIAAFTTTSTHSYWRLHEVYLPLFVLAWCILLDCSIVYTFLLCVGLAQLAVYLLQESK